MAAPSMQGYSQSYSADKINQNVNELSQKLLAGCKLLAESCPETNVPLVSTPDGRMYSVGTRCYYVKDAGGTLRKLHSGGERPESAHETAAASGGRRVGTGSPLRPSHQGAQTGASSEAREAWNGSGGLGGGFHAGHHGGCGGGYGGGFDNGRGSGCGSGAAPSKAGGHRASCGLPGADAESSLSARVAQKLLEGYTLLSESCPVTNVPLVQDAAGCILSVGTGCWFERQGSELVEVPPPPAEVSAATEDQHGYHALLERGCGGDVGPNAFSCSACPSARPHATAAAPAAPAMTPAITPAASSHRAASPHAHSPACNKSPACFSPVHSPQDTCAGYARASAVGGCNCSYSGGYGGGYGGVPAPACSLSGPSALALGPALETEVHSAISVLTLKLGEARRELASAVGTQAAAPHVAILRDIAAAIAALRAI